MQCPLDSTVLLTILSPPCSGQRAPLSTCQAPPLLNLGPQVPTLPGVKAEYVTHKGSAPPASPSLPSPSSSGNTLTQALAVHNSRRVLPRASNACQHLSAWRALLPIHSLLQRAPDFQITALASFLIPDSQVEGGERVWGRRWSPPGKSRQRWERSGVRRSQAEEGKFETGKGRWGGAGKRLVSLAWARTHQGTGSYTSTLLRAGNIFSL